MSSVGQGHLASGSLADAAGCRPARGARSPFRDASGQVRRPTSAAYRLAHPSGRAVGCGSAGSTCAWPRVAAGRGESPKREPLTCAAHTKRTSTEPPRCPLVRGARRPTRNRARVRIARCADKLLTDPERVGLGREPASMSNIQDRGSTSSLVRGMHKHSTMDRTPGSGEPADRLGTSLACGRARPIRKPVRVARPQIQY